MRPEHMCRGFPVHPLQDIFQVSLSQWLYQLCLLGDLNKCVEAYPESMRNGLFKTILPLKLSNQLKAAAPGRMAQSFVSLRPEQMNWVFPSITGKWPSQDHLSTKTIVLMQSCISQKNCAKLCLPREWLKALASLKPEPMSWVFPSVTEKWPFQNHLSTKSVYSKLLLLGEHFKALSSQRTAQSSVSPKTWTNELSLPQCHWEMAFSKPSWH